MKERVVGKTAKKANSLLMNNLGWISVLCLAGIYIFWGFYQPKVKDQSILETFLSGGISMIIALSISTLLSAQGLMRGGVDVDVIKMKNEHRETVKEANDYAEWADEWADEENRIALKSARTNILMSAGLKYSEFFNEDGDYLDTDFTVPDKLAPKHIKRRYLDKQKALRSALTVRTTPVSMARLSAETTVNLDPNKLDKEPLEFQKAKSIRSIWSKIFTVALFSKLTLVAISNVNVAESLFNGLVQLSIYLFFGIYSMYNSYNYMTGTYVGNLIKKKNLLTRLIIYGKRRKGEQNGNNTRLNKTKDAIGNIQPIQHGVTTTSTN